VDLILWRHAEAEDAGPDGQDLGRVLTARGEKQAARVAAWLDRVLPDGTRVLSSPAQRCQQTAQALGRKFRTRDEIGPEASVQQLLDAAQWPVARQPVLIVGHQPGLGEVIAHLMGIPAGGCAVRKGTAWWLRTRERGGHMQSVVVAVQSPDAS
jgi:phosphohistidine phosphatase